MGHFFALFIYNKWPKGTFLDTFQKSGRNTFLFGQVYTWCFNQIFQKWLKNRSWVTFLILRNTKSDPTPIFHSFLKNLIETPGLWPFFTPRFSKKLLIFRLKYKVGSLFWLFWVKKVTQRQFFTDFWKIWSVHFSIGRKTHLVVEEN